jgi:hypothetical protein
VGNSPGAKLHKVSIMTGNSSPPPIPPPSLIIAVTLIYARESVLSAWEAEMGINTFSNFKLKKRYDREVYAYYLRPLGR